MMQRRYILACIRNAGMRGIWFGESTFWERVYTDKSVIRMLSVITPIKTHVGSDINESIAKPP